MKVLSGKKCFTILNFIFILLVFSGCKNFLNGSDLKEQLDAEITLAKAASVSFEIDCNYGKITPSADFAKKVGQTFTLSYLEVDSGYCFERWICSSPAVKIVEPLKDTTEVEVLAASKEKVVIRPVLHKRPVVTEKIPGTSESGNRKDSSIIVRFSKKMNPADFKDFSKILIVSDTGKDLTPHFVSPVLSDDGYTLTIRADRENLIDLGTSLKMQVIVSLSGNISDAENVTLGNTYEWNYTINNITDETAPSVAYINASRDAADFASASNLMKKGTFEEVINSIGEEQFFTDTYHVSSINFDFKLSDEGSGIEHLLVKEKLLYDTEGTASSETKETIVPLNDYKINDVEWSGVLEYNLSKDMTDGIMEVEVIPVDFCGNKAKSVVFPVIKDTSFPIEIGDILYGAKAADFMDECPRSPAVYKDFDGIIFCELYTKDGQWANYNNIAYCSNEYEDIFERGELYTLENKLIESVFSSVSDAGWPYLKFTKMNNKENYKVKIIFTDRAGNEFVENITVSAAPEINSVTYVEKDNKGYYSIGLGDSIFTQGIDNSYVLIDYSSTEDFNSYNEVDYEDDFMIPVNSSSDIIYAYVGVKSFNDYINMWSDLYIISDVPSYNTDTSRKINFDAEFEPVRIKNSGLYKLTVNIPSEEISKYESLYIEVENSNYESGPYTKTYPVSDTQIICYVPADGYYIYKVCVCGKKENLLYKSDIKDFEISKESSDDYCAPWISTESGKRVQTTLKFIDYPSQDLSGLIDENGNINLEIYHAGFTSKNLSEDEILQLPVEKITINPAKLSANKTYFYPHFSLYGVDGGDSDYYKIYLHIKDKNGNYIFENCILSRVSNITEEFIPYYNKETGKLEKIIKMSNYGSPLYYNFSGGSWSSYKLISNISTDASTSDFIKVIFNEIQKRPYYLPKVKKECQIKLMKTNFHQVGIKCEENVFYHVLCSPINFGNNIDEWEFWVPENLKVGEGIIKGTSVEKMDESTFRDINIKDVPVGYYYCVIAYFADNTCQQGQIFRRTGPGEYECE
ncbi:MAG: hypothetical protein MJ162_04330 [Treponema sp.]|nr:hypothetical protein [Treponema sp.]